MKKVALGLIALGFTFQIYAQDRPVVKLPEVTLVNTNYKYLSSVDSEVVAIPVEQLETKIATFNIKELDIYEDEYDYYDVYFIIPEGKILASYDKEGNILRTIEKFKNTHLPAAVAKAILKRFPNWNFSENIYVVNYKKSKGATKHYKLTLENGDKRIKVKLDALGNFL